MNQKKEEKEGKEEKEEKEEKKMNKMMKNTHVLGVGMEVKVEVESHGPQNDL